MAKYDGYSPMVVGPQLAPVKNMTVALDTSTEIGYRFTGSDASRVADNGWVRVFSTTPPPGIPTDVELYCRLYNTHGLTYVGDDRPLRQVVIPCSGGDIGTGSLTGSSITSAMANPSDEEYITLSGSGKYSKFRFDTTGDVAGQLVSAYAGIFDVSVLYVVSGPFADDADNIMTLGLARASNWVMDSTVSGPAEHLDCVEIRRSRLGPLLPWWDSTFDPATDPYRAPWVYRSVDNAGLYDMRPAGTLSVQLSTGGSASGDYVIHYIALQVTYSPVTQMIAGGGVNISAGAEVAEGLYAYTMPLLDSIGTLSLRDGVGVGTTEYLPSIFEDDGYIITVGMAYSGPASQVAQTPVPIDVLNVTGSLTEPYLGPVQVIRPLRAGATPTFASDPLLPAIVLYQGSTYDVGDAIPANANEGSQGYLRQRANGVSWYGPAGQTLLNTVAADFVQVALYVRAREATNGGVKVWQADNTWAPVGPAGYLSYADIMAYPEVVDGWRKVIIQLDTPVTLDGLGTPSYWIVTGEGSDYEVMGMTANPTDDSSGVSSGAQCSYGGETAYMYDDYTAAGKVLYPADMTLCIGQQMSDVDDLAVSLETQSLSVTDSCYASHPMVPTGLYYHALSWTPVLTDMVSGWAHYEVQRRDTTMDDGVWETIAEITSPYVDGFDDYEARVGVVSSYRIRTVHEVGFVGDWSDTVTSTITSPGVTGDCVDVGVMMMTTNSDASANCAYVNNGGRGETFSMVEAGWASLSTRYGVDYQFASRPTERGGVQFSRTVVTNLVGIPDETLDRGVTRLRDLAWDDVPYVCVRDELSNRWLSTLTVPDTTVRRVDDGGGSHIQVASVTVTETSSGPCAIDVEAPYLGFNNTEHEGLIAYCDDPSEIATMVDVDYRIKLIITEPYHYLLCGHYATSPDSDWYLFLTAGEVGFFIFGSGGSFAGSMHDFPYIINQPIWLRVVYDHDVGAGNATAWIYYSFDGSSWTLAGSDTAATAALVGNDTGVMYFTPYSTGQVVQECVAYNYDTSTRFVSPDFSAQTDTSAFVDDDGNTWNIVDINTTDVY